MSQFIILEDPQNRYWRGALVEREKAHALQAQGVISMPVEPTLFHTNAVAGFFRRDWGGGWAIPQMAGPCGPMVMHVIPNLHTVNWVACIVGTPALLAEVAAGKKPIGLLRLVTDSGQRGLQSGGLSNQEESVIDVSTVGDPSPEGTWIIRGRGRIDASTDLLLGFTLYGHAHEMRVAWAAISQTE